MLSQVQRRSRSLYRARSTLLVVLWFLSVQTLVWHSLLVGIDLAPSTAAHLIGRLIGITSVALPLCDRPVHPVFLLLGTKVSQYNGQGWNMLARRYARAYFFGPIVLK